MHAADVNMSFNINTTDAVKITRRFVGSDTSFIRGDWVFEKPFGGDTLNVSIYLNDTVIVNGSNITQNFDALCVGDMNASYLPPLKSSSKIEIEYFYFHDLKKLNSNVSFELPIFSTKDLNVRAISMILKFPKNLVEIDNVQLSMKNEKLIMNNKDDNLVYNVMGDELRIGWFANVETLCITSNTPVIIINCKTTSNFKSGDIIKFSVANNSLCEFADEFGEPIDNVVLKTYSIEYSNNQNIGNAESILNNDLFIFPNPAENIATLRYKVVNDGFVKISLYNVLGEKLFDVVNKYVLKGVYNSEMDLSSIPDGVYSCRMICGESEFVIRKIIISK